MTTVAQITTTESETTKTEHLPNILYKNTKYGFVFSFDPGYKDLWAVSEKTDTTGSAFESALLFTLQNAPNPEIFTIHIYTKSWWEQNAEIDSNKSTWLIGKAKELDTALGKYLGANKSFVFTLFPNDQTCPDL